MNGEGDPHAVDGWWRAPSGLTRAGVGLLVAAASTVLTSLIVVVATATDVEGHDGIARVDPSRLRWIVAHRNPTLVDLARWVTVIGDPPVLVLLALAASAWLWRRGTRRPLAVAPTLGLLVAAAAVGVLKVAVNRPRPPVALHLIRENAASFPSGHATDSTALFVTLALVAAIAVLHRPVARAAIVAAGGLLAAGIGMSRLVLGVHWPSDVLAGWALGLTVAISMATGCTLAARRSDPTVGAPPPSAPAA